MLDTQPGDWDVTKVTRIWETLLTKYPKISAAYFHNDDMALAAYNVMKSHNRTDILLGGCDAMPPALAAVSDGRMLATVRNPSCRIHGGAIIAGVAAVTAGEKTGRGRDPQERRHGRPRRHQSQRARHGVDGRALPDLVPMELLSLRGIGKRFGGVTALADVDFSLARGEIHGLVGENGAGKSTLMKIIAGVHDEFDGEMRLSGTPVRFRAPRDARDAGIGMVHQELATVPTVSLAENVFMGAPPMNRFGLIDWPAMRRAAPANSSSPSASTSTPRSRMGSLPLGLQQLVELSRVLFSGAEIIILDEPTSALSPPEVERLFTALRRLREAGRSLIFISHFLDDVLEICDRVTVFRNGRAVATEACSAIDKSWIIDRMIGTGHENLGENYTSDIQLQQLHRRPRRSSSRRALLPRPVPGCLA